MRFQHPTIALVGLLVGCGRVRYLPSDAAGSLDDSDAGSQTDASPLRMDARPLDARPLDDAAADAFVTPDAALTVEAALEAFAAHGVDAACQALHACLAPIATDYAIEDCTRGTRAKFAERILPGIRDSIRTARLTVHPEAMGTCLDELDRLARSSPCELLVDSLPEVCIRALEGQVPPGGRCTSRLDCQGDDACVPDGSGMCAAGVCTPRAGVGMPCSTPERESLCERDLRCVAGTCRVPVDPGAACTTSDACGPDALCLDSTCRLVSRLTHRSLGMACDLENWCAGGASCSGLIGGTCRERSPSRGPCIVGAFPEMCPTGERCQDGRCTTLPPSGAACGPDWLLQPRCAGGGECISGRCTVPGAIGALCASSQQCASASCSDGRCTAPPACDG